MSYRRTDSGEGLPSINGARGLLGDASIRRSLTRLDDLEQPARHVAFRPLSPPTERSRNGTYRRSPSPIRGTRSPRARSPVRAGSPNAYRSGSPVAYRSVSPTNYQTRPAGDQQEQLRILREELRRKDEFHSNRGSLQGDNSFNRQAAEAARADVAALNVKVENLSTKLRDAELENDANTTRFRDMKSQMEQAKENEARQTALAESLRERLRELEMANGNLETVKSRTEASIHQIGEEKQHLTEKIRELETRMRNYLQERESAEIKASSWEKRYQESLVMLRSALGVDYNESVDVMKVKIQEMAGENTMLKGKLCTLEESLANSELEAKASRETIARLVSEVNNTQASASRHNAEAQNILRERDSADAGRREMERECEILRERLDASQRAWNATKHELEEKTRVYSSLDHELRDNAHKVRSVQTRLDSFVEQLGVMLGVSPSEDLVKDRIRQLQGLGKDGQTTIHTLEEKTRSMNEQLRVTFDQKNEADQRLRRAELQVRDLEENLRRADRELGNAGAFRDGLRTDKEHYLRFMERLGEIMKMDRISAEVGYDMTGEALLARASQLAKMEADALADRSTHIYNLQRKIKTMKEQMESKDLHLDLLRKKIGQLEERVVGRSEIEKEKDSEALKVRRLERTCEKYSREIESYRMEITDLKAQLLESTKYQVDNQDLISHCEKLETRMSQIDKIRQKQAKKISHLKDEVNVTELGSGDKLGKAENAIGALSSELKTTKSLLDDMAKREKQLVDLRTVLARMLGLDVNTLAVPDYEIISRMEKLIQAHHAHTLTNWTMDRTLESMEDGLRSGYPEAKIYLGEPRGQEMMRSMSHERRSRSPEKVRTRSPERRRARSPSPTKVDTRKY